jgi:hypothetical protein
LAVGNFSRGSGEGEQFRHQTAALLSAHFAEDGGDRRAAMLIHGANELSARLGDLQDQIATISRIFGRNGDRMTELNGPTCDTPGVAWQG